MSTITKEQAQKIIEAADEVITALAGTNEDVHPESDSMLRLWDDLNDRYAPPEVVRELARIALASLEAEAVAYADPQAFRNFQAGAARREWMWRNPGEDLIPLFTTPPAPVSDSLLSELLGIAKRAADEADECAHAEFSDDSMEHSAAIADWERRAAMLQCAENAESPATMQTAPALDSSQKIAESPSSNSPVIPDGWVAVPVEPTEDMIVNGFESEPCESFSNEKEWEVYEAMSGCQQAAHRAKLCWAAMISAAPKI